MNTDNKRLAILASIFCPPLGLLGFYLQRSNPQMALNCYKAGLYIWMLILCLTAIYTFMKGGNFIPVIGSFY